MRKSECKTIIIDDIEENDKDQTDFEEHKDIPGYNLVTRVKKRLLFFEKEFLTPEEICEECNFLGYANIYIDSFEDGSIKSYIDEALIHNSKLYLGKSYLCCNTNKIIRIANYDFNINGSYFVQQQGKINCCSHANIRMVGNTFRACDAQDYHHSFINKTLCIDVAKIAADGLNSNQIREIFEQRGLKCFTYAFNFPDSKNDEDYITSQYNFQQMAYYAIESGFPVLIIFKTGERAHVICAFGHTFNENSWLPEAEQQYFKLNGDIQYLCSTLWVDDFIIHDDNYGPYYCLPASFLADKETLLIAITNLKTDMFGHHAEFYAIKFLYSYLITSLINKKLIGSTKWNDVFFDHFMRKNLILRTLYVKKDEYLKQLRAFPFLQRENFSYINNLPSEFWLTEISVPELFNINKKKIAEVIINPKLNYPNCIKAINLPSIFILNENDDMMLQIIPKTSESPLNLLKLATTAPV